MIRISRRSSSEIPAIRHAWPTPPATLVRQWAPPFAPPALPSYLVSTTATSRVGHAPHAVAEGGRSKKGHSTAVKPIPANRQRWWKRR